jgi:multicomponent Na+:H+ antiporter subunit G
VNLVTLAGQVLIGVGVGLTFLAAVGIVRLPDVLARMHAGTKAASLGLACVLLGAAMLVPSWSTFVKALLAIGFQLATAPVAAHVIGRAAYRSGAPLWRGTWIDELGRDRDEASHPAGRDTGGANPEVTR